MVQKADRKQSRAEKACASFLLGIYDKFDYTSAPYPRTDPRRIASGRNRTKLVSSAGINAMFAESAFYDATADTHGGKSRRPGKNDKYYVAASGRRIRKK